MAPSALAHAPIAAPPLRAARPAAAAPPPLLRLQRLAGNGAVTRAVRQLQRKTGWDDADPKGEGWNAGTHTVDHVRRIPLGDLVHGYDQHGATKEQQGGGQHQTKEAAGHRAIALVPEGLDPTGGVRVMIHFHGLTSRGADPYAGWRQRKDGNVRDVDGDKIEAQIHAAGDKQLLAILPQGTDKDFGDAMSPAAIREVLDRLTADGVLKSKVGDYSLVLSAHSAGGDAHAVQALGAEVRRAKDKKHKASVSDLASPSEVILFEAIWPGLEDTVMDWCALHLNKALAGVVAAGGDAKAAAAAVAAAPVLRAYYSGSPTYAKSYEHLDRLLEAWFAKHPELGDSTAPLRDHFKVGKVPGSNHESIISGVGDASAGPLADALRAGIDPKVHAYADGKGAKPKVAGSAVTPKTPKTAVKQQASAAAATKTPAAKKAVVPDHAKKTLPATTGDPAPPITMPASGFVGDVHQSTLSLLTPKQQARFGAIAWNGLDYPGAKMKVKDTSEANLARWRSSSTHVLFEVKGAWYIRGAHQGDAQALFDALAAVRPGGGERRANDGSTALLTESEYGKDPDRFDAYIVKELRHPAGVPKAGSRHMLNQHAASSFSVMQKAAAAAGVSISIGNSFRERAVAQASAKNADNSKAVARYSSHSLGLAMDLNLAVRGLDVAETTTAMPNSFSMLGAPAYKWMYLHGAEHGWYQYRNEPWHWEYNPAGFLDTFWSGAPDLEPATAKKRAQQPGNRAGDAPARPLTTAAIEPPKGGSAGPPITDTPTPKKVTPKKVTPVVPTTTPTATPSTGSTSTKTTTTPVPTTSTARPATGAVEDWTGVLPHLSRGKGQHITKKKGELAVNVPVTAAVTLTAPQQAALDKIRANRAALPPITKGWKSGENGYAFHDSVPRGETATPAELLDTANPDHHILQAIWDEVRTEGGLDSINTYDSEIVTWGKGYSAKSGSMNEVLLDMFKTDPAARDLLMAAGIALTAKTWMVVNSETGQVEMGGDALRLLRYDRTLLQLFVRLGSEEQHVKSAVDAQWAWVRRHTADKIPAYARSWGTDAIRLMAHFAQWMPAYRWGNVDYSATGGDVFKLVRAFGAVLAKEQGGGAKPNGALVVPRWLDYAMPDHRIYAFARGVGGRAVEGTAKIVTLTDAQLASDPALAGHVLIPKPDQETVVKNGKKKQVWAYHGSYFDLG